MRLLDLLYYTGIPIAISSTSAVVVFLLIFDFSIDYKLIITIFTITFGSYNMDRIKWAEKDKGDHPERSSLFIEYKTTILIFVVLSLILGIAFAFMQSIIFGILVIIAPSIVFLYSFEIGNKKDSIKKIPYAKNIVIAGGWSALILVVLIFNDSFFTIPILICSFGVFGKFYIMAVVYDFKDISTDRKMRIKTLPNSIGEKKTKAILHFINIISTIVIITIAFYEFISVIGYLFIPAFFYQVALIEKASENAPDWVFYGMCDLEQFFWLLFAVGIMIIIHLW